MKTQLESVQLKENIKVLMPDEVLHKIKYLCNAISQVEWSGILLYKVEGSIKTPKKLALVLKDIIPMHKGTQAYTEYTFNEPKRDTTGYDDRMIDYFNENMHALEEDWKIGHIHSHNNMNVFFSGTDTEELRDNSPSHNFYLSLIVNNRMDFCAKVSFIATVQKEISAPYTALDENGIEYSVNTSKFTVKKEKMYVYDCDIEANREVIKVDDFFTKSVGEIIQKADVKPTFNQNAWGNNKNWIPAPQQKQIQQNRTPYPPVKKVETQVKNTFGWKNFKKEEPLSEVDEFIISLLGEDENFSSDSVEDSLDYLDSIKGMFTVPDLVSHCIENYLDQFEYFFDTTEELEYDFFIQTTSQVIHKLSSFEKKYTFLPSLVFSLKQMLKNFTQNGTTV